MHLYQRIVESTTFLERRIPVVPSVAIVTGTGLEPLAGRMKETQVIPYDKIPGFPVSTAPGHAGKLQVGELGGKLVAVLSGRWHHYEGYSMEEIVHPVRSLAKLGISDFILTNVSGSVNPEMKPGQIVGVTDHINWMFDNPLIGENFEELGTRFPDMSEVYDRKYLEGMSQCASRHSIPFKTGVYLGLSGPSLETKAEYQLIHNLGADLVGMSTVPESIAIRHMNRKLIALSVVSNLCYPTDQIGKTLVEDVIAEAKKASTALGILLEAFCSDVLQ